MDNWSLFQVLWYSLSDVTEFPLLLSVPWNQLPRDIPTSYIAHKLCHDHTYVPFEHCSIKSI